MYHITKEDIEKSKKRKDIVKLSIFLGARSIYLFGFRRVEPRGRKIIPTEPIRQKNLMV